MTNAGMFTRSSGGSIQIGDFVVGSMDEVLSRLFNQSQHHGPPPTKDSVIKELPRIEVTEKQVSEKLECCVCKSEFVLKEKVIKIPCGHIFHEDCIIPWLKRANNCPVCRFELESNDPEYERQKKQREEEERRKREPPTYFL